MRADAYDAYDAYDSYDSYDAYDAYGEARGGRRPNVRTKPASYGAGGAAKPTEFVTRTELQLALAPVSRDIAAAGQAVSEVSKRVEGALSKIDKDATSARRDMAAARKGVQSAQMMALLPMMLTNNTPAPLTATVKQITIPGIASGSSPTTVNVVTDVEYAAGAGQQNNNSMMMVLLMMMMMGGMGGSSDGKEFGGGNDNNMMFMVLIMMMFMKPQTTVPTTTASVATAAN